MEKLTDKKREAIMKKHQNYKYNDLQKSSDLQYSISVIELEISRSNSFTGRSRSPLGFINYNFDVRSNTQSQLFRQQSLEHSNSQAAMSSANDIELKSLKDPKTKMLLGYRKNNHHSHQERDSSGLGANRGSEKNHSEFSNKIKLDIPDYVSLKDTSKLQRQRQTIRKNKK